MPKPLIYALLALIPLGVIALVGLNIWWSMAGPDIDLPLDLDTGAPVDVLIWEGIGPLECAGNQRVLATMKRIRLSGQTAVRARGNCEVELIACNIRAGVGIEVGGNAHVVVRGGEIWGTQKAIEATLNSDIEVFDARLRGTNAVVTRGNADVVIERSTVQGGMRSIHARGGSVVLRETNLIGRVDDPRGRVEGAPSEEAPAEPAEGASP